MGEIIIVIGGQWGDEGKGKIVDYLSQNADFCVRFQGGANAGHTIKIQDETYKLRLTPSGVLQGALGIIGAGTVINLDVLEKEISELSLNPNNVIIDKKAILILPCYIKEDEDKEILRKEWGETPIGTTKNGIGIAYQHKALRIAFRVEDILNPDIWVKKARVIVESLSSATKKENTKKVEDIVEYMSEKNLFWKDYIYDCGEILHEAFASDNKVVIEGAQGTLLDITHGTYPFVTSSTTISGGVSAGIGCAIPRNSEIIGVTKAYCTRVGAGEFISEAKEEYSNMLRSIGEEYGVVTGRNRRCGWLNLDELRYAHRLNGFSQLALTKVDVLDGFENVYYYMDGELKSHNGWDNTKGVISYSKLPPNLKSYIHLIEEVVGVRITIISTGSRREDTILREVV
jgi:adenylosuccinate synthase